MQWPATVEQLGVLRGPSANPPPPGSESSCVFSFMPKVNKALDSPTRGQVMKGELKVNKDVLERDQKCSDEIVANIAALVAAQQQPATQPAPPPAQPAPPPPAQTAAFTSMAAAPPPTASPLARDAVVAAERDQPAAEENQAEPAQQAGPETASPMAAAPWAETAAFTPSAAAYPSSLSSAAASGDGEGNGSGGTSSWGGGYASPLCYRLLPPRSPGRDAFATPSHEVPAAARSLKRTREHNDTPGGSSGGGPKRQQRRRLLPTASDEVHDDAHPTTEVGFGDGSSVGSGASSPVAPSLQYASPAPVKSWDMAKTSHEVYAELLHMEYE